MKLTALNKLSQFHNRPFVFPHIITTMTGDTQQLSTSKTQSSSMSKESNECINKRYACDVQLPAAKWKNEIKSVLCTTQRKTTDITGTHRVQMC